MFFRENQYLAGEGIPKVAVTSSGPVGSAVFVLSEGVLTADSHQPFLSVGLVSKGVQYTI